MVKSRDLDVLSSTLFCHGTYHGQNYLVKCENGRVIHIQNDDLATVDWILLVKDPDATIHAICMHQLTGKVGHHAIMACE